MTANDGRGEAVSSGSEAARPTDAERRFTCDGQGWIARAAGEGGVGGPGAFARAVIVVVYFSPADQPKVPVRQAQLPAGRFEALYEEELCELFRTAKPIPPPEDRRRAADPSAETLE